MKLLRILTLFSIAILTIGTASAQTRIYVTGSTAFRTAFVNEANAYFSVATPDAWDGTSTDGKGANVQIWHDANNIVKASWSGSSAGIQTVAGAPTFTVNFLKDIGSGGVVAGGGNPDPRGGGTAADPQVPDIAMSDVFQGGSPFNGTVSGVTYAALTQNTVAVVTFRWTASNGFPAGAANVTPQLAQYIWLNSGLVPLSLFTGSSADVHKLAIATGRDPDSGTRGTAFAESGIGIFNGVTQWHPKNISAGSIGDLEVYPGNTINGIFYPDGDTGESSGSTLRGFLNNTVSQTAINDTGLTPNLYTTAYLVTYLGVSDSNTAIGNATPAVGMTYNGVAFSQAAVEAGQYTFWGYEHLDYKGTLDGNAGTGGKLHFANSIKAGLLGETDVQVSQNCKLANMAVSRSLDGANVIPIGF